MTYDPQDILARFHRALVREIRSNRPEALTSPFSVAEIYQNLVPYRTHRDEIGVEINGDYEHALLRLLAGEGEFLTIESRTARQEIKEELETPNPNTSLYRDFAAADVLLNPDKTDEALQGWEPPAEGVEDEVGLAEDEVDVEVNVSVAVAEDSEPLDAAAWEEDEMEGEVEGEEPEAEMESMPPQEEAPETPGPESGEEGIGASEETEESEADESEADKPSDEGQEMAQEPSASEEPELASQELQGKWRDPSSWLEPSIETLREEYEQNRGASLLETGEAFHGAEEVASEGLPFEVSVQKGEGSSEEDPPEEEEVRVEETAENAVAVEVPENCAWCREKLPDRPGVNFCPFCGMSVKLVPCPECGEELELNWRFCIACGTEVSS